MIRLEQLNQEIETLRKVAAQEKKCINTVHDLQKQQTELRDILFQSEQQLQREKADVTALESMTLKHFFSYIKGNREELLEKEQREVVIAKLQYDRASCDLQAITEEINQVQKELYTLQFEKNRLPSLLKEKSAYLVSQGGTVGAELAKIEEKIAQEKATYEEVQEAKQAGAAVQGTIGQMEGELDSASNLGTWDMLGGGLLVTMAKHDHINQANALSDTLSRQMSKFRTELSDISIDVASTTVELDGFSKVGDFLFDGLIMDWFVQSKIGNAKQSTYDVKYSVNSLMSKLTQMEGTLRNSIQTLEKNRQELVDMY